MFQTGSKIILAPNYGCHQKSVFDQYMWLTSTYSSNNQLLAVVVSPLDFFHLDTKSRSSKSSSSLLSLANLIASNLERMERMICMPWSQVAKVVIIQMSNEHIGHHAIISLTKPLRGKQIRTSFSRVDHSLYGFGSCSHFINRESLESRLRNR